MLYTGCVVCNLKRFKSCDTDKENVDLKLRKLKRNRKPAHSAPVEFGRSPFI